MPNYVITAPDGQTYEITTPDGVTEQQAIDKFKVDYQQFSDAPLVESPEPSVVEEPEYDRNWYDAPRAALQGMTLGFSDELGAGAGALMAKGMQAFNDDETDISDIYRQMKDNIAAERAAYEEANPAEALALNIAGGLGTGIVSGAKTLGSNVIKNAPKWGKALSVSGVGAGEGAIAGAGAAGTMAEVPEEALQGATIGAVLPLALRGAGKGVGKVVDTVSRKRIAQDLVDSAGNFTPINLAGNKGDRIPNLYSKVVGPSYGGGQVRQQNKAVLEKTQAALELAKQGTEAAKTTGKQALQKTLRSQTRQGSLPYGVSDEQAKSIINSEAGDAVTGLQAAWGDAFPYVKGDTFVIDINDISKRATQDLEGAIDGKFQSNVASKIDKALKGGFNPEVNAPKVKYRTQGVGSAKNPNVEMPYGEVDGQWLMQARNDLRLAASELPDEGASALEKKALQRAAKEMDRVIRDQLPEDLKKVFNQDLQNWGNFQTVRKGTGNAGVNKQSLAEPEDLLSAGKRNQRAFEEQRAPFQRESQQVQRQTQEAIDAAQANQNVAQQALDDVNSKITNIDPAAYNKAMSTATMAAPLALINPSLSVAAPGISRLLGTQGAQKTLAGQTDMQKMIAELLRKTQASDIPQGIASGISTGTILQNEGQF